MSVVTIITENVYEYPRYQTHHISPSTRRCHGDCCHSAAQENNSLHL
uniref:Uncharacterized protein n=1 Tax=Anguilla anguilla TaxID=7936 RepID=A0A0E9Q8M9_ANGAN